MKDKVLKFFYFLLGIACIFCILLFQNKLNYLFLSLSSCIALFGILFLFTNRKIGFTCLAIGSSGLITYLLYVYKVLLFYDCVTFFVSLTLLLLFFLALIYHILEKMQISKKYSQIVDGVVVAILKNLNTKKESYKILYQYQVEGEVYEVETPFYKEKGIPSLGDTSPLYLEPSTNSVYFPPDKKDEIFVVMAYCFFILACGSILFSLF